MSENEQNGVRGTWFFYDHPLNEPTIKNFGSEHIICHLNKDLDNYRDIGERMVEEHNTLAGVADPEKMMEDIKSYVESDGCSCHNGVCARCIFINNYPTLFPDTDNQEDKPS